MHLYTVYTCEFRVCTVVPCHLSAPPLEDAGNLDLSLSNAMAPCLPIAYISSFNTWITPNTSYSVNYK